MEISEILNLLKKNYLEQDIKSGPLFLLSVLSEEIGELNKAIRYNENIEEEIADVIFMIFSIANIYRINPEKKLIEKYLNDPEKIKKKWKDIP
ncbi:MAG: MazG nucleotide pyrophosphohydrolase domain-containing protein [Thermoplasmata archaeon]